MQGGDLISGAACDCGGGGRHSVSMPVLHDRRKDRFVLWLIARCGIACGLTLVGEHRGRWRVLNLPRPVQLVTALAQLVPIDAAALAAHTSQWVPYLAGQADAGWDWAAAARAQGTEYGRRQDEFLTHCALWSGQLLEAMMVLSGPHSCAAASQSGAEAVYIEFVAIAPWHRGLQSVVTPTGALPPSCGIGGCLMNEAITLSHRLGWGGRTAWHSKASAVQNYQRMFQRSCGRHPLACGTDPTTLEVAMEIDASLVRTWHYP